MFGSAWPAEERGVKPASTRGNYSDSLFLKALRSESRLAAGVKAQRGGFGQPGRGLLLNQRDGNFEKVGTSFDQIGKS